MYHKDLFVAERRVKISSDQLVTVNKPICLIMSAVVQQWCSYVDKQQHSTGNVWRGNVLGQERGSDFGQIVPGGTVRGECPTLNITASFDS